MRTILVASDAPSVRRDVVAAIEGAEVGIVTVASGPAVLSAAHQDLPDLIIVDLQMGNMGGMAVCLELRLQESYDVLDHVPVLMLLDRRPDVFLARRSGAEGWLVKPLDPLRLRLATRRILAGEVYEDQSYQPVPVLVGPGAALGRGADVA